MAHKRGIVSRAASALLFCAAALAALTFSEGSAQVPFDLAPSAAGYNPADPRFNSAALCAELGGELQGAGAGRVCSGLDDNGTFCIPGSAEAFPCRGLYKHVILCNAAHNRRALNPFFCGRRCAGEKARGARCERIVSPAEAVTFPPSTVYIAEGHTGAVAEARTRAGVTLDFAPAGDSSFTLSALSSSVYAAVFPPPGLRAALEVSLTARIACAGCYPELLTIIASFVPVPAPRQATLDAVYGDSFSHALSLPDAYQGGALSLTLAAAAPGFALVSGALTISGPDAGSYPMTVLATDSGLAGTLTLTLLAEISRHPLPESAWGLRAGDANGRTTIAAGYPPPFHRAASRGGAASLIFQPPQVAGLRTEFEGATAAFYADVDSGALAATAVLTVRHASDAISGKNNYESLEQTVALWVSIVAAPPQAGIQTVYSESFSRAVLAPGGYEDAALTLARGTASGFALEFGTLTLAADGAPDAGSHLVTVEATHSGFMGTLALVMSAEISRHPLARADWGLRAGDESARVTIAAGYPLAFHRAASQREEGSTVLPSPIAGLRTELEGVTTAFYAELTSGALAATALLTVRHLSDVRQAKRNYESLEQTVALWVSVVSAPPQPPLRAVFGDAFSRAPALPAGYADATVTLAAAAAGFALESGTLTLATDGGPDAGSYSAVVEATHSGFAGTLALTISAEISRRPLPEAAWGLRAGDEDARVVISPGYSLAFHRAASRNGSASLVLPAPIAGLRTELEGMTAAFYADFNSDSFAAVATLTVRHPSVADSGAGNYEDLERTVGIWVSVAAAPEQEDFLAVTGLPITAISLVAPDFAAGAFLDFDPADDFDIGADGVVSGTPTEDLQYALTAGWTSAEMLGTLALEFEVSVILAAGADSAALAVPDNLRPAGDYAGELFRVTAFAENGGVFDVAFLPFAPNSPFHLSTLAGTVGVVSIRGELQGESDITHTATARAAFSYHGVAIVTVDFGFVQTILASPPTVHVLADTVGIAAEEDEVVHTLATGGFSDVAFSLAYADADGAEMVSVDSDGGVRFYGGTIAAKQIKMTVLATSPAFFGSLRHPLRVRHKCTAPVDDETGERVFVSQDTAEGQALYLSMRENYARSRIDALCADLEAGADVHGSLDTDRYSYLGLVFNTFHNPVISEDDDIAVVRALDKIHFAGANLNVPALESGGGDWETEYVITHAVLYHYPRAVDFLVSRNVSMHVRGENGATPLMIAAGDKFERENEVHRIFDTVLGASGHVLNHVQVEYAEDDDMVSAEAFFPCEEGHTCTWQTALHFAAKTEYAYRVRRLVEAGASADELDNKNRSPLSYAAEEGEVANLTILLAVTGAKNLHDTEGLTSLHRAAIAGVRRHDPGRTHDTDILRPMLEDPGVFNTSTTRAEHSFRHSALGGPLETRVVPLGSSARDFVPCLGAVSDLMIAHGIVRRRTDEPTERCEGEELDE